MRYSQFKFIIRSILFTLVFGPFQTVRAENFTQDLSNGSVSPEVLLLEEVLCQQGAHIFPECANDDWVVDEHFGPILQAAVTRFQWSRLGIRNENILGHVEAKTRKALNAILNSQSATEFNAELESATAAYRSTRSASALAELDECAQERCEEMELLFNLNPKKARELAVTKKFRSRIPKALRGSVEESSASVKGTVEVVTATKPESPTVNTETRVLVTSKGLRYTLPSDVKVPAGTRLRVRGTKLGNRLIPGPAATDFVQLGAKYVSTTYHPGPTPLLAAILLEYPDLRRNRTAAEVAQAMNTARTYMQNASYGQSQLTVQTTQWLMSTRTWGAPDYLGCNPEATLQEALARANSQFNYANVSVVMPIMPEPITPEQKTDEDGLNCAHRGGGEPGGSYGHHPISTPDGVVDMGLAFVNDGILRFEDYPHTQIHEFIHCFNVGHDEILRCKDSVIDGDGTTCTTELTPLSLMGVGSNLANGWGIGELDAKTKEELGWFNSTYVLQKVTAPGQYTIGVLERATPGVKALKLDRNSNEKFWVEYRRPEGNDAGTNPNYLNGVFIHTLLPNRLGGGSGLVPPRGSTSASDAFVPVGTTWHDKDSQWAITLLTLTPDSATVSIDRAPPIECAPQPAYTTLDSNVTLHYVDYLPPFEEDITWTAPGATITSGTGKYFTTSYNSEGTFYVDMNRTGTQIHRTCVVNVTTAPTISYTFSPSGGGAFQPTLTPGALTTVNWYSSGADICTMEVDNPDPIRGFGPTGSFQFVPSSSPNIYYLACDNLTTGLDATDYTLFHIKTPDVPNTPDGNNASCGFIKFTPVPFQHPYDNAIMHMGETRRMQVVFINTGTKTWTTDETPHRPMMSATIPNWSQDRAALRREVLPGELRLYNVDLQLADSEFPPSGFRYGEMTWRMTENGVPFGQGCSVKIWLHRTINP